MAVRTRRSSLYFIGEDSSGAIVVTVGCATAINGLSAPRDQLEKTCLEDDDAQFEGGVKRPGVMSVTLNFDPSDQSHLELAELHDSGETVQWAVGWGDGPDAPAALVPPTLGSGDDFEFPTTRSYTTQAGYVSDVSFDYALNGYVTASVSVQMSGPRLIYPKTT